MLFPKKHISLAKSYLGYSLILINILKQNSLSVEALWEEASKIESEVHHSFEDMIYTLDFLYAVNAIKLTQEGRICLNY